MSQQKQVTISLKPNVGQTDFTKTFELNGYVKSMVAYTRGTEKRIIAPETTNPLIFMKLQDDNRGDIVPMILLDNYKQTGGEYEKSFKPLGLQANNNTFSLSINTERESVGDVSKDIEVFVTFFYGEPPVKNEGSFEQILIKILTQIESKIGGNMNNGGAKQPLRPAPVRNEVPRQRNPLLHQTANY